MIRKDESYLYEVLKKYSKVGEWKFFECFNESGETVSQAKRYLDKNNELYWASYPDFECYNDNKLILLVELKAYFGYFGQKEYVVAMKLKQFNNYKKVLMNERVDVRVCFALLFGESYTLYWESVSIMDKMRSKKIELYIQDQYNKITKKWEKVTEDYIFWYVTEFRTDYWNLPN